MSEDSKQYTIRRIPSRLDQILREKAERYGVSLNEAALDALARGAGLEQADMTYHDLDDLAGTWMEDAAFDKALDAMDRVDGDLWK